MKKIIFLLMIGVVVCNGCGTTLTTVPVPDFKTSSSMAEETQPVLNIIKLAPQSFQARAEYSAQAKTVAEWHGVSDEIIINGGYFNEDYSPSGYVVANSQRIGRSMFDQDKSGIVALQNNTLIIRDLKTDPLKSHEQFEFAIQSYPFLINDGQGVIKTVSEKRARRTAVGIDGDQNLYIITVTEKELSLYEFMEELIKTKIPFVRVLNLDGGPSTGLYMRWNNEEKIQNSYFPVPDIIRFTKK
jgi:uncharacterized protein YigE (DUF2233 family)